MELLTQLCPDAKKLFTIAPVKQNSKYQIDLAKEEAANMVLKQ